MNTEQPKRPESVYLTEHAGQAATAREVCTHRYPTSYGKGWVCANRACGVGIFSLVLPLPMPLVVEALKAIGVLGAAS